jgi:hypothetical protein
MASVAHRTRRALPPAARVPPGQGAPCGSLARSAAGRRGPRRSGLAAARPTGRASTAHRSAIARSAGHDYWDERGVPFIDACILNGLAGQPQTPCFWGSRRSPLGPFGRSDSIDRSLPKADRYESAKMSTASSRPFRMGGGLLAVGRVLSVSTRGARLGRRRAAEQYGAPRGRGDCTSQLGRQIRWASS